MNLNKAIKILSDYIGTGPEAEPVDFDSAIALGIEAIQRLEDWRSRNVLNPDLLLPSETE